MIAQSYFQKGDSLRHLGAFKEAETYYRRAYQKHDSVHLRVKALIKLGIAKRRMHAYDSAIFFYKQGQQLAEKHDLSPIYKSTIYNNLANVYTNQGDVVQSINYYSKSLEITRELKDTLRMANRLNNIGIAYADLGMFHKAIQNYTEAINLLDESKNQGELADLYNSIALLLKENRRFEEALTYHFKALNINENLNDVYGEAGQLNNIGELYLDKGLLDSATYYLEQSLALKRKTDDETYAATTLVNLGRVALKNGDFEASKKNLSEALHLFKNGNYPFGLAHVHLNYGKLFIALKSYDEGTHHLNKALSIAQELQDKDLMYNTYEQLQILYEHSGNPSQALKYAKIYHELKDSLISEKRLRVVEWNKELEKREIEKEKLIATQKALLAEKENRQQRFMILTLMGLVVLLFVFGVILWSGRKRIRQQNAELQRINEIVEIQKADIRHQTKNSLQRVRNIVRQVRQNAEDTNTSIELRKAENMIMALTALEEQLFDKPTEQYIQMDYFLADLKDKLSASHGVEYPLNINIKTDQLSMKVNIAVPVALIIAESVTNAVKYAFEGVETPLINIELFKYRNEVKLIIRDNGMVDGIVKNDKFEQKGFGSEIIQGYLKQLKGSTEEYFDNGFCRVVRFNNS